MRVCVRCVRVYVLQPSSLCIQTVVDLEEVLDAERASKYGCVGRLYRDWVLSKNHAHLRNFMAYRMLRGWRDRCRAVRESRASMRATLRMLAMRRERAALNGWKETVAEKKRKVGSMRRALRSVAMGRELKSFNSWHEWAEARKAKATKLKATLARFSPEGKAMMRVINKLNEMLEGVRKLRRALSGFTNRAVVGAWNKWRQNLREHDEWRRRMDRVMVRMSPEGRAMLKVMERLRQNQLAKHAVHRAVRAFITIGERRAFNSWVAIGVRRAQNRQSTVWLAAQRGHRVGELQSMLDALDADMVEGLITATDELGMTPLLWAAKRGFGDVVEVLLAFGSSMDVSSESLLGAQDAEGSTCLHHAARKSHNDVVSLLLDAGAPVNAQNADLSTPLHWAARKNNLDAIRLLLAHGADAAAKNKWGATPIDNAKFADHMSSVALLANDEPTRVAAEAKLVLERKLRPTHEELQAKLGTLAAESVARREATKSRIATSKAAKAEIEAMALNEAQAERRRRKADQALANALSPVKASSRQTASPLPSISPAGGGDELALLEAAVAEAHEAGNGLVTGPLAERLRAAQRQLDEMRTARQTGSAGMLGWSPPGQAQTSRDQSHRSPSKTTESPIERKLRRQKLAAKMASTARSK